MTPHRTDLPRHPLSRPRTNREDAGLLSLRLVFGLSMAILHGWSKLPVTADFISVIAKIGIPFSEALAWTAVIVEFVGGILICIGLFTRTAALGVLGTMLVAVFVRYANQPIDVRELALLHAAACSALLLTGPGRISVDYALARRSRLRRVKGPLPAPARPVDSLHEPLTDHSAAPSAVSPEPAHAPASQGRSPKSTRAR